MIHTVVLISNLCLVVVVNVPLNDTAHGRRALPMTLSIRLYTGATLKRQCMWPATTVRINSITIKLKMRCNIRKPVFVTMIIKLISPRNEACMIIWIQSLFQVIRWRHRRLRNVLVPWICCLLPVELVNLLYLLLFILLANHFLKFQLLLQFQLSL